MSWNCATARRSSTPCKANSTRIFSTTRLSVSARWRRSSAPRVQISGFLREDRKILLRVIDNGSGLSYKELQQLRRRLDLTFDESRQCANRHFGLYNINRRIKLLLGDAYGMSIFSNDNGTEVDILLPLLETKPEHPVLAGEAQEESNPPAEI